MDAISAEAIAGLATALESLLPEAPSAALTPTVLVAPTRVAPTGLGGFVGMHPDPQGQILGRRITARATVTVPAANLSSLDDAVQAVSTALMAASRAELAERGILRLSLAELGPRPVPAQGPPQPARRDLAFDLVYEFLKLPEAGEGIIEEIPLDIAVSVTAGDTEP